MSSQAFRWMAAAYTGLLLDVWIGHKVRFVTEIFDPPRPFEHPQVTWPEVFLSIEESIHSSIHFPPGNFVHPFLRWLGRWVFFCHMECVLQKNHSTSKRNKLRWCWSEWRHFYSLCLVGERSGSNFPTDLWLCDGRRREGGATNPWVGELLLVVSLYRSNCMVHLCTTKWISHLLEQMISNHSKFRGRFMVL